MLAQQPRKLLPKVFRSLAWLNCISYCKKIVECAGWIERIKKIYDGVRYVYGGNQSEDEVASVVNRLSDAFAQCFPLQKRMSLSSVATRRSRQPIISPFSTVCPTCRATLSAADAKQRSVKVYGRDGSVVAGR